MYYVDPLSVHYLHIIFSHIKTQYLFQRATTILVKEEFDEKMKKITFNVDLVLYRFEFLAYRILKGIGKSPGESNIKTNSEKLY